jgi:thioester reductase-like protein
MSDHTLITGFPGFLATHLLDSLASSSPDLSYTFLVQPHLIELAKRRIESLCDAHPHLAHATSILPADITDPLLGLSQSSYDQLASSISSVWHLAAIYDLAIEPRVAYKVNVSGTLHVLNLCERAAHLTRLNYVSTCYVSGDRTGTILEDDLDRGQAHKNHYEETKFWAEVEVQRRRAHIPTAIFRPGIVVGHSETGETDKYDGPYYVFKLLQRLPSWLPLPNIGQGTAHVNLVPINFAAQALAYLGSHPDALNKTFHLADPNPMRSRDILALALDYYQRPPARGLIPSSLVQLAMSSPAVEDLLKVPKESVMYFNHDAKYDTTNTQRALQASNLRCPHLSSYLYTLLDYMALAQEKTFLDNRRI